MQGDYDSVFRETLELILQCLSSLPEFPKVQYDTIHDEVVQNFAEQLQLFLVGGDMRSYNSLFVLVNKSSWSVKLEVEVTKVSCDCLAFVIIKNNEALDYDIPMRNQLTVLTLPGDIDTEFFASVVNNGLYPIFTVLIESNLLPFTAESVGTTKARFKELTSSFHNLKNSIPIPELSIHPRIKQIVNLGASRETYKQYLDTTALEDSNFLNVLQSMANQWHRTLRNLMDLQKNMKDHSALQEVRFWGNMESALTAAVSQLHSTEVQVTLEILSSAKRIHSPLEYEEDSGITGVLKQVKGYNQFLDSVPLQLLQTTTNLSELHESLKTLAVSFKKFRSSDYPVEKFIIFLQKVSQDVGEKILQVVPNAFDIEYPQFQIVNRDVINILHLWDEVLRDNNIQIREVIRRKQLNNLSFVSLDSYTKKIKTLWEKITAFRQKHALLSDALEAISYEGNANDLKFIYEPLNTISRTDNFENWSTARIMYNQRLSTLEGKFIRMFEQKLYNCQCSERMLATFLNFKPLMDFYPKLRSVMKTHQQTLIDLISEEISLIEKRLSKESHLCNVLELRNLSTTAAIVTQCKQVELHLKHILKQLEQLLGQDFKTLPHGMSLIKKCDNIMSKFNVEKYLSELYEKMLRGDVGTLEAPLLKILQDQHGKYEIRVNFDFSIGTLFKDSRNLIYMGYKVPGNVIRIARKYKAIYPQAINLLEQVQTLMSVLNELPLRPFTGILLKSQIEQGWLLLNVGLSTLWCQLPSDITSDIDNESANTILVGLEKHLSLILNDFGKLEHIESRISHIFEVLLGNNINSKVTIQYVLKMQEMINELSEVGISDQSDFVMSLNNSLKVVLKKKIKWFLHNLALDKRTVLITLDKGSIKSVPELHQVKSEWLKEIEDKVLSFEYLPQLCYLNPAQDFSVLHNYVQDILPLAYSNISEMYQEAVHYLNLWKKNERLWILEEETVKELIKCDMEKCVRLLTDILKVRPTSSFFEENPRLSIILTFEYGQVLSKILSKYDSWVKFLSDQLMALYMRNSSEFEKELRKTRLFLEQNRFVVSSLKSVTDLVKTIDQVKEGRNNRELFLNTFSRSAELFRILHIKTPPDFIFVEQLESELNALSECSMRKEALLGKNRNIILTKLESEAQRIDNLAVSLLESWKEKKPMAIKWTPMEAMASINTFEESFISLKCDMQLISESARIMLIPIVIKDRFETFYEELLALKKVWTDLEGFWTRVNVLLGQNWDQVDLDYHLKEFKQIEHEMDLVPFKVQQYTIFSELLGSVQGVLNSADTLHLLKDPSLKLRHWQHLYKKAGKTIAQKIPDVSLQAIISIQSALSETIIKDLVQKAKKEFVLEEALNKIKDFWTDSQYSTFDHCSGLKLVREWGPLRQACIDDLDELHSMKNSIYYKHFEPECIELENKLTDLSIIQLEWMDAQFYWIDLYRVVGKNKEMQTLLPLESSKFQRLTSDLKMILSKIFSLNNALDAIHIAEGAAIFRRIVESLKLIKSSLNDFLEKRRQLFPKFYFLGNDDLLKLIGAGEDLERVSIYLPKMYGSIAGLKSKDGAIKGVVSTEREDFTLINEVPINSLRCHEWLTLLDKEIRNSISENVSRCLSRLDKGATFRSLLDSYIFQVLLLSWQIFWTSEINECFNKAKFSEILTRMEEETGEVVSELNKRNTSLEKKKIRSLLVECLHYIDVIQKLNKTSLPKARLIWFNTQKFYYDDNNNNAKRVRVSLAGRINFYGFVYIGVPERLIYTPTLQKGYTALTEALYQKYGGCLFGPAGTGKTETVKSLGQNLGRLVVVFNCDDSYDFQSMARLMMGISQVGAWGCFDEFNRLSENIMSAVSSHVELIQNGLSTEKKSINLLGDILPLHEDTALFITLNPNYAGRSKLPENLKKKFREFSVNVSDNEIIAEIILKILGFEHSKALSRKVVNLFSTLTSECSNQKHYDFGLRTLKKTLKNCSELASQLPYKKEELILVESLCQIIMPTLIKPDEEKFMLCANEIFSFDNLDVQDESFVTSLSKICETDHLNPTDEFKKKCMQLYRIQKNQQALILAGEAAIGKTRVWKAVLAAIKMTEKVNTVVYRIATKTLKKEEIYGSINRATLEWKDGVFTSIVRQVLNDATETLQNTRVWVIFDSDMDPEYTETLNSALDDNKLITLPTGERLEIPENMRLIFETHSLDHTTPATITRCGLVLFTEGVRSAYEYLITRLTHSFLALESQSPLQSPIFRKYKSAVFRFFSPTTTQLLFDEAKKVDHIMGFDYSRVIFTLTTLIIQNLQRYSCNLLQVPDHTFNTFFYSKMRQIVKFSFVGDTKMSDQVKFINSIFALFDEVADLNIISDDIEFLPETLEKINMDTLVPQILLKPLDIMKPNIVIPTIETIKQDLLVFELLNARKSIILCGPPGSGKTMILNNALKRSADFELIGLNFSKDTNIAHIMKSLGRHTCYTSGSKGLMLRPKSPTKDIVLFCDEVNLPQPDSYGTQSTILFLREMIEKKGFWKADENKWVNLERIHVVGACNPPTDPGRIPMNPRFTRHVSILFVDYPIKSSLKYIYETFYRAVFQLIPQFKDFSVQFADASINLYEKFKNKIATNCKTHYLISPRELTRWTRGFYTSVINSLQHSMQSLVKMWIYEAWRVFADKLIHQAEKKQFQELLQEIVGEFFPNQVHYDFASSSLLFSSWLSLDYKEVTKQELSTFVQQRFQVFCEEEVETSFIIYDEMLSHLLRIDRVLRQVQGHAMLIGPCRTGKTTMTKFTAWLNGISIVQPNVHANFTISDFEEFLRGVLLSCSIEDKELCLIIDESNILEPSFLERMNTLLANSDIPDLFQEENYDVLINSLKSRILSLGLLIDTEQEMYQWFIQQISKNLHVIFTIGDPYNDTLPSMTTSPALFNRCAINWMGNWSLRIMRQIASSIIQPMPLDIVTRDQIPLKNAGQVDEKVPDVVVNVFIIFHQKYLDHYQPKEASPGTFLDALKSFEVIFNQKYKELEEKQRFVTVGLDKLDESVLKVKELNKLLSEKQEQLKYKENEAKKTLDKMLHEQNEAERKQEAVVEIKEILATHQEESKRRRKEVMDELDAFAPVLNEAQHGVKNIKKQQLTEIRSMINPPSAVKVTMEAVCAILGQKISSWREIQNFIRKDEFIFDIVNFDTETMLSTETKSFIEQEYFSKPDFTYKVVNRASKACGPLYQWVFAQLKYGEILSKAEPLKKEAQTIEDEALQSNARLLAAEDMIAELEESIENSKQNYRHLIRDIELIKTEMLGVQTKLERSTTLISNLTSERERWAKSTHLFRKASIELTGNCIISALYSNYCGRLVEKQRKQMFQILKSLLVEYLIKFDTNYQFVTHNVEIEKRFEWAALGLPNEEFFLENFSMVLTSTNVPYILDPDPHILSVVSRYYGKRFTLTSFLEPGFVKKLENGVRFGGVVLIQDAEYFDPIVNKLVSREYKAAGGRQTVQIGDHEVDLSLDFRLILYSGDIEANIPKFVEARVRLINFSMNKGSLEMKTLRIALFKEAPKMNQESNELMKLNGEYKIMLKTLEARLLEELNDSKGNILENDELIQTLERLKLESSEIENKLKETENFITKVKHFTDTYAPLGLHATILYAVLEQMAQVHWFYDLAMWQFIECLERIFGKTASTCDNRIEELVWNLYQETFLCFSSYMVKNHREAFAVVLFLTYYSYHRNAIFREKAVAILIYIQNNDVAEDINRIKVNCPPELLQVVEAIQYQSYKVALQQFQYPFQQQATIEEFAIHRKGQCILLGSNSDTDASFKVLQLANAHQQNLSVISLGSAESTHYAEQEIARSSTEGGWILLQNIQFSLSWTSSVLSRKLEQISKSTTMFMTCNLLGQELPSPLLQQSYKIAYEGLPGILDTVCDLYFNTSTQCRWKFLLCWFHSILLNRSLLAPIGFSKKYEFNDCDFACALQFLADIPDDNDARGKICYMLTNIIYGGKVDADADHSIIQEICNKIFGEVESAVNKTPLKYEIVQGLMLPEATDHNTLSEFLRNLQEPEDARAKWLGLPDEAIKRYETIQAQKVASQALLLLEGGV